MSRMFGIGSTMMHSTPEQIRAMAQRAGQSPASAILNRENFFRRVQDAAVNRSIAQYQPPVPEPQVVAETMLTNSGGGWSQYGPGIRNLLRDYAGGFITSRDVANRIGSELQRLSPDVLQRLYQAILGYLR